MMNREGNRGKVILAGAGPGDPELITLKALRYLQIADVIIADRLVSKELLKHARKDAVIIVAGKQGGNEKSTSQKKINALLVENARRDKLVLRLKGGDVSIFSNLLDELETLSHHKISYEIVPGVTAASGAAAMTGIPLTARGHAAAVRFLTCFKPDCVKDSEWRELALTKDTLVFYMSSASADYIVEKLLDHHVPETKYLAIIEQATTPRQQVRLYNLYEYEFKTVRATITPPAILIIGTTARLYQQFKWAAYGDGGDYFQALQQLDKSEVRHFTA